MKNNKLLLHTCCAPCISHVHQLLCGEYDITSYFYNPNIAPVREYSKRLEELRRFARDKGFPLIEGEYDARRWTSGVKHLRFLGERSERCRQCCRIRLERAFMVARDRGFGAVATTLSISPHKSAEMINAIGTELEKEYGVRFLESDFKKNGGYGKSVELSKAYGFYRQNYCGCIYSKVERDKTSSWNKIPRKII